MKRNLTLTFFFCVFCNFIFAQQSYDEGTAAFNPGVNSYTIGSTTPGTYSALLINGPNYPGGDSYTRDIVFKFASAGKSIMRAYRGDSWDTSLQFMTTPLSGGIPLVRMHIDGHGKIGIGTTNPAHALSVEGNILSYGKLMAASFGVSPNEAYNGNLMITKPSASAQHINLIREGNCVWSLGMLYNTNSFAIGLGEQNDALFTQAPFVIDPNGNIGIGVNIPTHKLQIDGTILAKEIKIENGWADFVFKPGYKLPTIKEVKAHIAEKGHLPNIPSESEVKENGIGLGEINTLLLQKIEELTLYIIQQEERIESLEQKLAK